MKPLALLVAALTPLSSGNLFSAEELSPSLAADAAALGGRQKTTWKSAAIEVGLKDGSRGQRILVVEFSPFAGETRDDPPHASARLSLSTPPHGVKGATASGSLGDGTSRDVRLQEKEGVRTITFVRALETISKPGPKAQERLNKVWSSSFQYELKKDVLVLKGFPKEFTTWGVVQFIAPEREITFKRVDP